MIGVYEKSMSNYLTIKVKLLTAKKAGFDFIEIGIDETNGGLRSLTEPDFAKEVIAAI